MRENRKIEETNEVFFSPKLDHLHDPFLMPDMELAVTRVLAAREKGERIVIFGDYDVDGVSSTAMLVRFLMEIGCIVSYRLPHRVHDGYGLKKYFFDELKTKNVALVITVDCGTRDIEVIEYAKSLGIDVIVTDHHAVPEKIPEGVPVLNPKRKDSEYPFPGLAGAGVAFKLLHAIAIKMNDDMSEMGVRGEGTVGAVTKTNKSKSEANPERVGLSLDGFGTFATKSTEIGVGKILTKYIDFASLGTVADCMPLTSENRTITTLGLRQMKNSHSHGLRKFLEGNDKVDGNADIIGFQIGPRINAAGRMDTPLTALRWLLASEDRCDEFLSEIEELNTRRQEVVRSFTETALAEVDPENPVLFFVNEELEHGLIGLVAGKLTETYDRPSIVLCYQNENKNDVAKKREYEKDVSLLSSRRDPFQNHAGEENIQNHLSEGESDFSATLRNDKKALVASCRSPEWCNLIELLDECKDYFVRYGGHRQAAGFTIEASKFPEFQETITRIFNQRYDIKSIPTKTLTVECTISPKQINLETLNIIHRFRPFGIGNPKPLWLLQDVTIASVKYLGSEQKHLSLTIAENPNIRLLFWNSADKKSLMEIGNIVSLVVELEENEWNGKVSIQAIVRDITES